MADTSFYQYLEAAFRHKLFKDKTATHFNYLGYNLSYERIFYYARKVLPSFYRNAAHFPNTEEGNLQLAKTVLEKLDFHRDAELENQFRGTAAYPENEQIIEQATAESQQTGIPPEQSVAAGAASGGAHLPSIPAVPSISSAPGIRFYRNIPQASEAPKPEVHITNKAGIVQEAPSGSKLVTATSGGAIREAPPKQIFIANKSGVITGVQNIRSPGFLKTFGSNAQIFASKNLGRIGQGLWNFGKAGTGGLYSVGSRVGSRGLDAFERISRPGGLGGGGIGQFSKKSSKKLALAFIGLLFFMVIIGGLIGNLPGTSPAPITSPNPVTGGGCPDTSGNGNPATCRYLNPSISLFDTSLSLQDPKVQQFINKNYGTAKMSLQGFSDKIEYIINRAKDAGLNPALFIGYWQTESLFSTWAGRDMGCSGDDFFQQVDCAVGLSQGGAVVAKCASSKDANSQPCQELKALRDAKPNIYANYPLNYPISTFDDFAEGYGSISPTLNGGAENNNCISTYNQLINVAKELSACQASSSQLGTPPVVPDYKDLQDLANKIKDIFNVTITNPTAFTKQHLEDIYKTLAMLYQSGKFAEIIRTIAPSITLSNNLTACRGFVDGDKTVTLGPCDTFDAVAYSVPHELGHTIQNRNSTIYTKYLMNVAYLYEGNLIYTYPIKVTGDVLISENFAEMITDSFRGPVYRPNYTKEDFKARYPELYQFAIQEIFGGVEFN